MRDFPHGNVRLLFAAYCIRRLLTQIILPAAGYRNCDGTLNNVGSNGNYWSSTPNGSENAWNLNFNSGGVNMNNNNRCNSQSVRLVR